MPIQYVLTTFSPAMFGEGATAHIKVIEADKAKSLIDSNTQIVATRVGHERLARHQLPGVASETARYANLRGGASAIHLHYRGAPVGDDGQMPAGSMITYYLIEVDEYQEMEA